MLPFDRPYATIPHGLSSSNLLLQLDFQGSSNIVLPFESKETPSAIKIVEPGFTINSSPVLIIKLDDKILPGPKI